jgi:type IV pilus assembly protein PilC
MALFKYVVKNQHGETVRGKVEARTETQAAAVLRTRGLLVISVKPLNDESFLFLREMLSGVKYDEIVTFTRQLSTMITAGLPLTQGLSILGQQSKPALARMVGELQREIEGGSTFAKALGKFPRQFSRVYVQLVLAGETGGVLDEVLERLAENMEKDKDFKAKTKGALIYPVIVMLAMVVVAGIMMIFVIPKLTEMYTDFGADLPFVTQLLIDISTFFQNFWWLMIGASVGGGYLFKKWIKTHAGRVTFDTFMLKVPIFGVLRAKVTLTELTRTLALLLGAGISLLQAIEIISEASDNILYREALQDSAKQVEKGIALSQAMARYAHLFPPILGQMIAVGEETGKLDDVLLKLSAYFQSESEHAIKNLTTALEPLIMIVLGVGVGLMVVAIIMPIYNLTSQF